MQILLLGSAAGGGFPQWNCWCPGCLTARRDPSAAQPRTQSSAAVSADGRRWFLLNASPDVRDQLRWMRTDDTPSTVRHVPIEGVILTDAELDHTLGIVLLREARHLPVYATRAVQSILEHDSRVLPTTRAFSEVPVTELVLNARVPLRYRDGSDSGLSVEAFPVPAGPPRFARSDEQGHTVGLMLREEASGTVCAFVPGCGDLDAPLLARLAEADALLFDGTFWTDDELIALGIGDADRAADGSSPDRRRRRQPRAARRAAVPASDLHAHQQHQPDPARALARAGECDANGCRSSASTACT